MPAPYELVNKYPINDEIAKLVYGTRNQISQILHDKDDQLLLSLVPALFMIQKVQLNMQINYQMKAKNFNENTIDNNEGLF